MSRVSVNKVMNVYAAIGKWTSAIVLCWLILITAIGSTLSLAQNGLVCDGVDHWRDVAGTQCLDGSRTGLEYICQPGLNNNSPLLVYMEGGGACWNSANCDCQPDAQGVCTGPNALISRNRFNRSNSNDGLSWNQTNFGQKAAFSGPNSPFKQDWNYIRLPNCTGDADMGNTVQTYRLENRNYEGHHKGYSNMALDLTVARSLFPNPEKVAVWANSSGGIGADCNLAQMRNKWPSARMFELNNAGTPFDAAHTTLMPEVAKTWGVWQPGPEGGIDEKTCPIETVGSDPWSLFLVTSYNRDHLTNVRKAYTDDYRDGTIEFYACQLGGSGEDCGLSAILTSFFSSVVDGSQNYKVYYHNGDCHDERERDFAEEEENCHFDTMRQSDVFFHDWVNAWMGKPSPVQWKHVR